MILILSDTSKLIIYHPRNAQRVCTCSVCSPPCFVFSRSSTVYWCQQLRPASGCETGPNNKIEESPLVVWVASRNMIPYALCRGLWYAYRYSMDVYGFRKESANFCGEEIGMFSTSGACGHWINTAKSLVLWEEKHCKLSKQSFSMSVRIVMYSQDE